MISCAKSNVRMSIARARESTLTTSFYNLLLLIPASLPEKTRANTRSRTLSSARSRTLSFSLRLLEILATRMQSARPNTRVRTREISNPTFPLRTVSSGRRDFCCWKKKKTKTKKTMEIPRTRPRTLFRSFCPSSSCGNTRFLDPPLEEGRVVRSSFFVKSGVRKSWKIRERPRAMNGEE